MAFWDNHALKQLPLVWMFLSIWEDLSDAHHAVSHSHLEGECAFDMRRPLVFGELQGL